MLQKVNNFISRVRVALGLSYYEVVDKSTCSLPKLCFASEDEDEGRGLICMFCGQDEFETSEELEDHIDAHPYTRRRAKNDSG